MISFSHKGNFNKATGYLKKLQQLKINRILDKYGKAGVTALSAATPVDTGKTAASWNYEITNDQGTTSIVFNNTNVVKGVNIAIILQHGHGTGTGGWVQGRDYINPAIRPIFDKLAKDAWEEVTKV